VEARNERVNKVPVERGRLGWQEDAENGLRELRLKRWRQNVNNREECGGQL
jgi:hypothetical protein